VRDPTSVETLAAALEADADAQQAGDADSIGDRYDEVLGEVLPFWDAEASALAMGFRFWDCWVDARNHDWSYYPGTLEGDWPELGRRVASALRRGVTPEGVPAELLSPGPTLRQRFWRWLRREPPAR
jgi:hypothetical protein